MLRDCFVGTFSGEKARDFVAYCARNFHLERIWIERNSGRFKGKQFGIGLDFDWSVLTITFVIILRLYQIKAE